MIRRFQPMLLAFLLPVFFLTQLISGYLVYSETRQQLTETSRIALNTTKENFRKHLITTRSRLIKSAQIVAADFGFRGAVASEDPNTILSALVNLSRRVGVSHASLVTATGKILADTADDFGGELTQSAKELLGQSIVEGQANGLVTIDGEIHQTVVVPVLAPEPIGWIFIANPIDKETINSLREQSTFDIDISFALLKNDHRAEIVISSLSANRTAILSNAIDNNALARGLAKDKGELIEIDSEAFITLFEDLRTSPTSEPIYMVIVSSINKALKPYDALFRFLSLVAIIGFVVTVFFAVVIARRMTKPLGEMVSAAKRYQAGDYSKKLSAEGPTELVDLASSLNLMSEEIAEREQQIFNAANFDDVTQLPNTARALFEIKELKHVSSAQGLVTAAVIRIENIADVRTTIGQDMANLLVAKIVERLKFLENSESKLYRVSENELLYIISSNSKLIPERIAANVATALDAPITLSGIDVDPQVHIGFARHDEDTDPRALIRRADVAAEQAANNGSLFDTYNRDYDEYMAERLSLVSDMRRALENDEMSVFYQPKIDLSKNEVRQVEALLRWHDPERGVVSPEIFIPLAEKTGYIRNITGWVIERAFSDCSKWLSEGYNVKVAINLSAKDLVEDDFVQYVRSQLLKNDLDESSVAFEITESAVIESREKAFALINKLRKLGLDIAIDDYGTGESSLSYLKALPATELKIDKSFIIGIEDNPADQIIVRSAIELSHNLGMKVTAEGIENISSESLLRNFGCDYGQGWLYAKPLSVDKFMGMLRKSNGLKIYADDKIRSLPIT